MTTTSNLELAKRAILRPAGLTEGQLEKVLATILTNSVDSAELYFQFASSESWSLEDGIIKDGGYALEHGVGVRALSGEKVGYAYSDDLILPALEQAATAARTIASSGGKQVVHAWQQALVPSELYSQLDPIKSISAAAKVALLHQIDAQARKLDPRIQQVFASLAAHHEIVLIVASDGTFIADVRPLVRLNVSVVAEHNNRREQASYGGGGRGSYEMFLQQDRTNAYVAEAVRQVLVNLESIPAPAGTMPVVLGPGWPGVLLHEAIGHGLEGDFNRKQSSAFADRLGQRVASPLCTIVDDGTLPGRRGSLQIDDEGTPSSCTTLIENGILKGYMQDKLNASLMGVKSTGNGRRESYACPPLPRMTNTYMLAGKSDPQEIISSVKKGLYAVNFGGGQVDITSGKFVFNASEAYLIENGKVTSPVKGATLIGNGPDVLTKVTMVGNDLQLDPGIGVCGKDGQSVPVGVGQPTLLVSELTVGGTA